MGDSGTNGCLQGYVEEEKAPSTDMDGIGVDDGVVWFKVSIQARIVIACEEEIAIAEENSNVYDRLGHLPRPI